MAIGTLEVLLPVDRAAVFPTGVEQLNTYPLPRGKVS